MFELLKIFTLLLLIAFALLTVAKKFKIPYSIVLVLSGFAISLFKFHLNFHVSYETIMLVFIPALVFKEAISLDVRLLNTYKIPVLVLVLIGISGQVILLGYILHFLFGFALLNAFLFSVIIIPTDPVGVLNILEEIGADERIKIIAEGESLFDDAVAIIIFGALMSILLKEKTVNLSFFMEFLSHELVLSFVLGLTIGILSYVLIKFTEDIHLQVVISLVTAFGGFLLATYLHSSGILLVVFAGLLLGNISNITKFKNVIDRDHLLFWDIVTFLLTTILYLFIGIIIQDTHGLSEYLHWLLASIAIFLIMFLLRWFTLTLILKGIGRLIKEPFSLKIITFMAFGSMKGPISLAMLIALPMSLGNEFVFKACIIGYSIIMFSILIQGSLLRLTAKKLLGSCISITE